MPLVKQVGIKNPSTGNYDMRDVGAEAQNVAVSYDSNGTVIEDINAQGVTVSTTKSTAKAIKDIEAQLSSLDNFIEGYLYNGAFYKESTHTTLITAVEEKFYVDLATEKLYRYNGTAYIEVSQGAVYENKTAAKDGTDVSLVTTGDKYNWNHKEDAHFVGTQAQWEALNSQQKAQYTIVDITDDYTPGGGGHTIINASGVDMTARSGLQFVGANVTDDSSNNKTVITVDVSGKADKVSGAMSGDVATLDANGNLTDSGKTLGASVPSNAVFTDTKNTAGSTDSSSKLFLIGATSQAANPQTYSQDTAYVGTDGNLYSDSKIVATRNIISEAYNSTATYYPGDYLIYNNVIYKVNDDIVSVTGQTPPNATYYTPTTVGNELSSLNSGLMMYSNTNTMTLPNVGLTMRYKHVSGNKTMNGYIIIPFTGADMVPAAVLPWSIFKMKYYLTASNYVYYAYDYTTALTGQVVEYLRDDSSGSVTGTAYLHYLKFKQTVTNDTIAMDAYVWYATK